MLLDPVFEQGQTGLAPSGLLRRLEGIDGRETHPESGGSETSEDRLDQHRPLHGLE